MRLKKQKGLIMETNPEILRYLTALQPMIREAMGPLQANDRFRTFYRGKDIEGVVIHTFDDLAHCYSDIFGRFNIIPTETGLIPIPAFCDFGPDGKPTSRCLVGMLDIPVIMTPIYNQEKDNEVVWWEMSWVELKHGEWITNIMGADNPYLALLRALEAQWGIEIN